MQGPPHRYVPYGLCVLVALLLACGSALAQERVRVFELTHRSGAEVKAMVEPVVPDSVALSATGFRLIARGTPAQLEALATLIRDLDAATPDIIIETRRTANRLDRERGIGAQGRIGTDEQRLRARVYSSRDAAESDRIQRARGQAGRPVYINRSLELPVRDRSVSIGEERTGVAERTHYRSYRRGFHATAIVNGDRVRVEISTADDQAGARGAAQRRRLITTVTGTLGEWLLLGGVEAHGREKRSSITRSTKSAEATNEQLWLRVRLAD